MPETTEKSPTSILTATLALLVSVSGHFETPDSRKSETSVIVIALAHKVKVNLFKFKPTKYL